VYEISMAELAPLPVPKCHFCGGAFELGGAPGLAALPGFEGFAGFIGLAGVPGLAGLSGSGTVGLAGFVGVWVPGDTTPGAAGAAGAAGAVGDAGAAPAGAPPAAFWASALPPAKAVTIMSVVMSLVLYMIGS
jgi:hypothetical protein